MEILNKNEVIERNLFETNKYMIVGCYLPHEFLNIIERHIFAVPIKMFKKEQELAQWIWDMEYYTQSEKISIPKAVNFNESLYTTIPENVPLKLEEKPNEDPNEDKAEWYFKLNSINIGYVKFDSLPKMEYTFYDGGDEGWGKKLFNMYRNLFNKMEIYPKAIVKKYGIVKVPVEISNE